jgi:hypothetical protein
VYSGIDDKDARLEDVLKDLEKKGGCMLSGEFDLDKVNGNFHISFHGYMELYMRLLKEHTEAWEDLSLSYKIDTLHFGLPVDQEKNQKFEGLVKDLGLNDMLLPKEFEHKSFLEEHFMAHHYMEIIPYSFTDTRDGFTFRSYENSFNRKTTVIEAGERESTIPILQFIYKFSALSAKYEIVQKKFWHFTIEILGVIGAVIAIARLMQNKVNSLVARFSAD